jgi:integrase
VRSHAGNLGPAAPLRNPLRDQSLIRIRQAAQVCGLPGPWLVQLALGCAFEDPGDLGEQVGPPARELAEFGHRGFRYHDLRHYFASLLIASGANVKTVQARLRHASAKTTLDTYGHIWPDRDESTRAAVDAVITARTEQRRNSIKAATQRSRSAPF